MLCRVYQKEESYNVIETTIEAEWTKTEIEAAWSNTDEIPLNSPSIWRRNHLNNLIHYNEYNYNSDSGWEVEFITPLEHGGKHEPSNLRAVH